MTTKELADELRMTPNAVRIMRHRGQGPAGAKVRGRVLYDRAVVKAWMSARFAADPLCQRALAA
ncbi:helix-turn-helix domain-containing protein [Streptomyces sp. ISL-111]|uniref:helix-turn-helix domain-containing protein n=1 Tax=Streptomyces sp. ISL-111 TaxID=2819175 RepID=UPI0020355422|nr:helix-turn-helix domain-containing protein [Streptomyces sp. ISL-111]